MKNDLENEKHLNSCNLTRVYVTVTIRLLIATIVETRQVKSHEESDLDSQLGLQT